MKFNIKIIMGLMLVFTVLIGVESTAVHASEVSLYYVNASSCMVRLSYNNNTAKCTVSVTGKSGTSSISGTLELYDVTDGKFVKNGLFLKLALYTAVANQKK